MPDEPTEIYGVNNACSEFLRHSGKPYPRTCRACGLGPCRNILDQAPAKTVTITCSGSGGSPDETPDELLNALTAEAYAAGRRDALAEAIDWRSILVRYARAVMDDDIVIGDRCLTDHDWCPEWTDAEREAVALIRQEALPERWRSE